MQASLTLLLYGIWLALAVVGSLILFTVLRRRPKMWAELLPPQRERAVPWNGVDILFMIVLVYMMLPGIAFAMLEQVHFFEYYYGVSALDKDAPRLRMELWFEAVAFPMQLWLFFTLLRIRGRLLPYQIGLTRYRLPENVIVGFLGWLVLTPFVFAVLYGVESVYSLWSPNEEHPLVRLAQANVLTVPEWILIFFLTVVAAPVIEELFFRGLLQRWVQQRTWGPDVAIVFAFILGLYARASDLETAMSSVPAQERWIALGQGLAPGLFVLLMIPGYIYSDVIAWRWLPYPNVGRSIYATALLFAACHSSVWPSPVPLFLLALGLGFVAYRTQSLVASITFHALFNLVSCIAMLFLPPTDQAKKGSGATSALRRSPPASTSTLVPGVSWPRRM